MRAIMSSTAFLALLSLTACATASSPQEGNSPPVAAGECRPDDAKALEGQVVPAEDRIKVLTGATTIRSTGPDGMLTQDFRVERVTLIVDPQTRKILRASCG